MRHRGRGHCERRAECLLTTRWSGPAVIVAAPSSQWIASSAARNARRAGPLNQVFRTPQMETPSQVRIAVWLLWASLAAATLASLWEIATSAEHAATRTEDLLWLLGATVLLGAIPTYFVSRRANWARIVTLVLIVLGVAAMAYLWSTGDISAADPWLVGTTVIDVVAVSLLFTGAGSKWFRHEAF